MTKRWKEKHRGWEGDIQRSALGGWGTKGIMGSEKVENSKLIEKNSTPIA